MGPAPRRRRVSVPRPPSVVGRLPAGLFPGAGSGLYRGLGSVVVGGLALSAVLTLVIVPPLMSVFLGVSAPKPHETEPAAEPVAPAPEAVPVRVVAGGGAEPDVDDNVVTWPQDGRP